jgi:DNA invertase Pin-like site-specific DNA recombinase
MPKPSGLLGYFVELAMKKVVSFIRVSTEEQATKGAGISSQKEANQRTAQQYGLKIVRTFELADVSGTQVMQTSEMRQLMALMDSGEIEGVVVKELSRLMRPENFDLSLLQHFVETKTLLYLPDGPHDLASDSGYLLTSMMGIMAGFERRQIISRMTAGKESKRKQGKHVGGTLPLGTDYDFETGKWSWNADAVRVQRAYELVLKTTRTYADIARELDIKRTALRPVLKNPIYTGYRVWDTKRDPRPSAYKVGTNGRQGFRTKVGRSAEDIIRVSVLPELVSQDIWNRVQKILSARAIRQMQVRNRNSPRYVLNGFIVCGECGTPMYSHSNRKADYYYCKRNSTRARQRNPQNVCPTPYILSGKIESKIEELLSERLQDRAFLTRIASAFAKRAQVISFPTVEVDVEARIQKLERKRERVNEDYWEERISKELRNKALAAINVELGQIIPLKATRKPLQPVMDVHQLATVLRVFRRFKRLAREDKRSLLKSCHCQIEVSGYTIKSLNLIGLPSDSNNDNHLPAAAALLPEHCAGTPAVRRETARRYAKVKPRRDGE